jgi:hypothetical protein
MASHSFFRWPGKADQAAWRLFVGRVTIHKAIAQKIVAWM